MQTRGGVVGRLVTLGTHAGTARPLLPSASPSGLKEKECIMQNSYAERKCFFFCSEEGRLVGGYSINIVATKLHRYAARGRQLLLEGYERNLQMKLFSFFNDLALVCNGMSAGSWWRY